jgi:hypothetical protein
MSGPGSGPYRFLRHNGTLNVSDVPKPTTWATMIFGFFGIGLMAYCRKAIARGLIQNHRC